MMTKRTTAERQSCPQRNCISRVGWNCGNSSEQQGRKRNEAAASRDCVHNAAKEGRKKQQNRTWNTVTWWKQPIKDVPLDGGGSQFLLPRIWQPIQLAMKKARINRA